MDLDAIDLFAAVARAGGFSAVARDRGVDPSAVSRAIAGLEREIGVRLFQRTTRRLSLTEAGEAYLARVDGLIDDLRRAAAEASSAATAAPSGVLRLTTSIAFGLRRVSPLIPALRARYPDLRLDCQYTDAATDLVGERFDLALRLAPAIEGDLIAVKLLETRYCVAVSPAYLKSAPPLKKPADLAGHRVVALGLRAWRSAWTFRAPNGAQSAVEVAGDVKLSTPLAVCDAAVAGLGPALLPSWLIEDELRRGRLIDLFPGYRATASNFDTGVWAVYPSRAYLPSKTRAALDFFKEAWRTAPERKRPPAGGETRGGR